MLAHEEERTQEPALKQRPDEERQPAPELGDVWIISHNISSINTVGIAAVQEDALVHVWPEANILARSKSAVKDVFAKSAITLHTAQAVSARTASGCNGKK